MKGMNNGKDTALLNNLLLKIPSPEHVPASSWSQIQTTVLFSKAAPGSD